jgi:hypothetical protein
MAADNGSSTDGIRSSPKCFARKRPAFVARIDCLAYPKVLHLEIRDSAERLWRLATQDAEWSPSDPGELIDRSIEDAEIDEGTGELRCKLSDGSLLDVKPTASEASDDPPIGS